VCCSSTCVPGECCDDAHCKAEYDDTYVCTEHTCGVCDPVTGTTYYVDPAGGDDLAATGSGTSGGASNPACAFRTITAALAAIGTADPGTEVVIRGPATVSTGETFPITVPENVLITSAGGTVTVEVPPGEGGFLMLSPSSGLRELVIDGVAAAAVGVAVGTGSDATTEIVNVTVQNMQNAGIAVLDAGELSIGEGVVSQGHAGTTGGEGLFVADNGHASISVSAGAAQTAFIDNGDHGIMVLDNGSVELSGVPGVDGDGTVVTSFNANAGVWIEQSGISITPSESVLDGLVSWANKGNGLRLKGGSAVKVRNSYILANALNGIHVDRGDGGSNVARIDLGTPSTWGANTVQASLGSNPNSYAGICFSLPNSVAGATLQAAGNIFSGSVDCSEASPAAIDRVNHCIGYSDVGVRPLLIVNTANCPQN